MYYLVLKLPFNVTLYHEKPFMLPADAEQFKAQHEEYVDFNVLPESEFDIDEAMPVPFEK